MTLVTFNPKLASTPMIQKMVIMKLITSENYLMDTRLIDQILMLVQSTNRNMIGMNMIMPNRRMAKDESKVLVKN